jgi:UDPglucose 6-dehydrogenase
MHRVGVIGLGYVGEAYFRAFSTHYQTIGVDICDQKLQSIADTMQSQNAAIWNLTERKEYPDCSIFLLCLPTDSMDDSKDLDTSLIEPAIAEISKCYPDAAIVIKSTLPANFCQNQMDKFPNINLLYSPEFLREDSALEDVLYPERTVVSGDHELASEIGQIFLTISKVPGSLYLTDFEEAELIKLGANSFLALRVAFFNEIDSYCFINGMNSRTVLDALCADRRIGNSYNNPSFGYGGYCLPKDTNALGSQLANDNLNLLEAVSISNTGRLKLFVDYVLSKKVQRVGFYGTEMKTNSLNSRSSSALELAKALAQHDLTVHVYEPTSRDRFEFLNYVDDKESLEASCELVFANRISNADRAQFGDKLITRDIYGVG